VFIPVNRTIIMDISPNPINSLVVQGTLLMSSNTSINLTVNNILIDGGTFQIGSQITPLSMNNTVSITITGKFSDFQDPV